MADSQDTLCVQRSGIIKDSFASVDDQAWTAATTVRRIGLIRQNSTRTLLPEKVFATAAAAFVFVGDVGLDDGVVHDGHADRIFDL